MYMSSGKKFFLAALVLVTAHQSEATCYFANSFKRVGNEAVTVNGLFSNFVVHPYASRLAKQNLPDAVLLDAGAFQLQAHELWQLLAAMLIEAVNAKLLGASEEEVKRTLKLVVYGAALHKVFATACKALGLDTYFSDEDKDAYDDYGRSYVQAFFAMALDEYNNPEYYAAQDAAKASNNK